MTSCRASTRSHNSHRPPFGSTSAAFSRRRLSVKSLIPSSSISSSSIHSSSMTSVSAPRHLQHEEWICSFTSSIREVRRRQASWPASLDWRTLPKSISQLCGRKHKTVVIPENSIRLDSRGKAKSAHHPTSCLRSSTCLDRMSPTCSSRGTG